MEQAVRPLARISVPRKPVSRLFVRFPWMKPVTALSISANCTTPIMLLKAIEAIRRQFARGSS